MTTTLTPTLDDYARSVDADTVLGRLCWYSISELCKDHKDVVDLLAANGLDKNSIGYPRNHDVFKRVCFKAQRTKVATGTAGRFNNYMMRPVTSDNERVIIRRLVIETRDAAGKKLGYEQVRDFAFNRDTGRITVTALGMFMPDPTVDEIAVEVRQQYALWVGKVDAYRVREMIRQLLLRNGATCVREGGAVYFISEQHRPMLESLESFCDAMGTAVSFHSLPLVDDAKQRTMVRKAYEAESIGAIDTLIGEITTLKKSGEQITQAKYAKLLKDYRTLGARTKDYEKLLETSLHETEIRLNIFERQIRSLLPQVKN